MQDPLSGGMQRRRGIFWGLAFVPLQRLLWRGKESYTTSPVAQITSPRGTTWLIQGRHQKAHLAVLPDVPDVLHGNVVLHTNKVSESEDHNAIKRASSQQSLACFSTM